MKRVSASGANHPNPVLLDCPECQGTGEIEVEIEGEDVADD